MFDLRSYALEPTFIFDFEHVRVSNVKIDQKMAKLVKLTSNIDLDLITSVFDLTFILDFEHFSVFNVEIG